MNDRLMTMVGLAWLGSALVLLALGGGPAMGQLLEAATRALTRAMVLV